jgi:hypothetical protein
MSKRECDKEYEPQTVVISMADAAALEREGYRPLVGEIAATVDAVDLAIEKAREQSRL